MTPEALEERKKRSRAQCRAWYHRNIEAQRLRSRIKIAKAYAEKRDVVLARNRKWASENKDKIARRQKQYREENSDKRKAQHKRWWDTTGLQWKREYLKKHPGLEVAMAHKRRALQRAATINLSHIQEWMNYVKSKDSAVCYYCQQQIAREQIHFDHIVPLSRGGAHSVENLCVACASCNLSKNSKNVRAWVKIGQQFLEL